MELLEYLEKYPLPDKEEDMTIEQSVIKDIIDDIKMDFNFYINEFYDSLMHYCLYQEEKSYGELKRHITTMISDINILYHLSKCYFSNNSILNKYIDIKSIDEENFNSIFKNEDQSSISKYKEFIFRKDFEIEIESMLKTDARIINAKKYFGLEV